MQNSSCSQRGNITPHSFKCRLHIVTSFQRSQYKKGGKRLSLQWRNQTSTILARASSLTRTVINHANCMHTWYNVMKMVLCLCGLPSPKLITIVFSWEKHQTKPSWGTFCKISEQYFKIVKIIKNKECLRNCHCHKGPKKTWLAKCNVLSWTEYWNLKRTLRYNWGNQNKVWALVSNNVLILVH